jgi:hypothetical protein
MDIFQRFAVYTRSVDVGPFYHEEPGDQARQMLHHPKLTPAQHRRLVKKHRAATFRVDMEGKPMGRINRLRRRFDRVNNREVREAAARGGALYAWQQLVIPAPLPTGGARSNPDHPSRKHDVPS